MNLLQHLNTEQPIWMFPTWIFFDVEGISTSANCVQVPRKPNATLAASSLLTM